MHPGRARIIFALGAFERDELGLEALGRRLGGAAIEVVPIGQVPFEPGVGVVFAVNADFSSTANPGNQFIMCRGIRRDDSSITVINDSGDELRVGLGRVIAICFLEPDDGAGEIANAPDDMIHSG